MNVNFNGYDENVLTFEAGTNLKTAGVPVKMTDDGKVTACTSGEVFCGICLSLRGGYATVQLKGYVTMPAKSKITVGWKNFSTQSLPLPFTLMSKRLSCLEKASRFESAVPL